MSDESLDCEKNTPDELVPALNHIRNQFEFSAWCISGLTETFCHLALHPDEIATQEQSEQSELFAKYRTIVVPEATEEFNDLVEQGTPPALFKAYFSLYLEVVTLEARRLFQDMLQIGIANAGLLDVSPVSWSESHVQKMALNQRRFVEPWIKRACDKQDFLTAGQDVQELMYWRTWRAPRFIHMQPSGNTPYDPATAWYREDESHTQRLLANLSWLFVQCVVTRVGEWANTAHVSLAKQGKIRATKEGNKAEVSAHSASVCPPPNEEPAECEIAAATKQRSDSSSKIRSRYKIAIREGLINVGLSARAQQVATWIAENFENTEFPHITHKYGMRADLGNLYRTDVKFRSRFDRDVTDMRTALKRNAT